MASVALEELFIVGAGTSVDVAIFRAGKVAESTWHTVLLPSNSFEDNNNNCQYILPQIHDLFNKNFI